MDADRGMALQLIREGYSHSPHNTDIRKSYNSTTKHSKAIDCLVWDNLILEVSFFL